ncbi:TolC family protein [Elusimicrobiota bacterium]
MRRAALLVAILLPCGASAQEISTVTLSMSEAVERAIAHSEDVSITRERGDKLKGSYIKARSRALPQLLGTFRWSRYADKPVQIADFGAGPQEVEFMRAWEMDVSATLTQVLWAFGRVKTAIDAVKDAMDVERFSQETAKSEVAFATKRGYLTILLARDTLAIAEQSHQNALENQRAMTARIGGGRASRVDNVKMAVDVESRVPPKLEARSRLDSLMIAFRRLIGADRDVELALTDELAEEFPVFDRAELEGRMLEREPSLRAALRQVGLSDRLVRLRKSNYMPTLSAMAQYRYYGNDEQPVPEQLYFDPSWLLGIRLDLPIWGGGHKAGSVREASRDRNMADLAFHKRKRDLVVELDSALSEYRSVIGVYRANGEALKLAEESYGIAMSSFKAGRASQAQLNDAELQLTGAKLRTRQSLYNIHMILARIERLTSGEELP